MNENAVRETADILSIYSYKMNASINLLIEKGIFSKDEFNNMLSKIIDEAEEAPETDEYVIEELRNKAFIK